MDEITLEEDVGLSADQLWDSAVVCISAGQFNNPQLLVPKKDDERHFSMPELLYHLATIIELFYLFHFHLVSFCLP